LAGLLREICGALELPEQFINRGTLLAVNDMRREQERNDENVVAHIVLDSGLIHTDVALERNVHIAIVDKKRRFKNSGVVVWSLIKHSCDPTKNDPIQPHPGRNPREVYCSCLVRLSGDGFSLDVDSVGRPEGGVGGPAELEVVRSPNITSDTSGRG
jgi:hypothetical protein